MTAVVPLHTQIQLNTRGTEDEPVLLMEVIDSTLDSEVLRFCSRPIERISTSPLEYGVISNGDIYIYAISGTLPSEQEGQPLRTQIVVDNVTQEYTDKFVGLSVENTVTIKAVLASDPDTNIRAIPLMYITNVANTTDNMTLTLDRNRTVVGASSNLEPWPSGLQTMTNAPGLHRQ